MGARFRPASVLDEHGRPYLIASATHDAATQSPRWYGLNAPDIGPNAANLPDLPTVRARCRAIERSHGMIAKGIRALTANVVGCGAKPQSLWPDRERRRRVHELWSDWVDVADADGRTDYYGVQNLAVRHMIIDGEAIVRLLEQPMEAGMPVPLQVQVLAPDLLATTRNERLADGNIVRAGIEFDARTRRRVAYRLLRTHPSDADFWGAGSLLETERVPAEDIVHLYHCESAGQIRGWPMLARGALTAHTKGLTFDAALQRMAVAAMFAGWITSQGGSDAFGAADESRPIWEPGTLGRLRPDENIIFPNMPDVGAQFGEFQHWLHLELAADSLVTFEQLTGDLSQVNYSSIRAGLIEFGLVVAQLQHLSLNPLLNRVVWNRWLPKAVVSGAIDVPAAEFRANRLAYSRVRWIPPARPWVDPMKEVAANIAAVRAGFRSRSSVIAEFYGEDAEQVEQDIADDNRRADALGLVFDSDPRRSAKDAMTLTPRPEDEIPVVPAPKKQARMGQRQVGQGAAHA